MPSKIKFNADLHEYTLNGRKIPSVTTVLKAQGLIDDRFFTEESRKTGTTVHEILELLDLGHDLPPSIGFEGYINAYQSFLKSKSYLDIIDVEKIVYESIFGYAGKLDRIFQDTDTNDIILVDIKTGAHLRSHPVQCSAYALAYGGKDIRIAGLHLNSDGTYKYKEFKREDNVWKACITVYNYKERR